MRRGRRKVAPTDSGLIGRVMGQVAEAAAAFESRWTLAALKRVDGDLYQRFVEQQDLFNEALITGDEREVEVQAAALSRGWLAIAQAMEGEADDAYRIGFHGGTRVAIGEQKHAITRVRELWGEAVIWITPDEVAALVAGMELLKQAKNVFPDAELIDLYPAEEAKEG